MKLCWDNIENIKLTKNGNFRDIVKKKTYYYHICKCCGDEFLGTKSSVYCGYGCSSKDQWDDPLNAFNSKETKQKISSSVKKLWNDISYKQNTTEKIKRLWSSPNSIYNTDEYRDKIKKSRIGNKNGSWKGGYDNNVSLYDTYAPQIEWCEDVRRNKNNPNILEVRCFKCDKWFIPTRTNVRNRLQTLKDQMLGECRFYCSYECKNSCSIFGKSPEQIEREDAVRAGRLQWLELQREVQQELRSMVLERDDYECVKCGSNSSLQCHHIMPVSIEPLLSADMDNCITLCYDCHIVVHQKDGCRYNQLYIEEC